MNQLLASRSAPTVRIHSSDEMRPLLTLTPAAAQPLSNFVVFEPTALPGGTSLGTTTLRPEAPPGRPEGVEVADFGQTPYSPGNPCSLRTSIRGAAREVRIKQFLYDWAPSAAGIASLWDSPTVDPFPCQRSVGWIGIDYHGTLGGCVCLARTTIEIAVVSGEFSPGELQDLMRGLRVANPGEAAAIEVTGMHRLNYWVHYQLSPYRVPYGLWAHPHKRLYDHSRIVEPAELPGLTGVRPLGPAPEDATLDSLLLIEDASLGHHEVEVIARCPDDPDPIIWMTGMSSTSERAIPWPPKPVPEWAGEVRETTSARGTTLWLAALTARFGAWEALWEEEGFRYAAWFGASQWWDRDRVVGFIERLRPLA